MTKLIAMAVPILPGQTERWHNFLNTLQTERLNEYKESRERLGVHERVFFQHLPQGDFAIVTMEGNDPQEAFSKFGQGSDSFTQWFCNEVKAIHGLDLTSPPQGVIPEQLIEAGEAHISTY